ncbi:MAG: T9SS type B sorting domain-containing protein, partial [Bacteroidota bacterium]
PTISQAGEYRLTVIDLDNGCSSQERVIVRIDTISPSIDAGATLMLQCGQNGVVLNGAIANNTRSYDIVWTGAAGDVIDNSTSLNPTVYQDGMYQLVVTDRLNGCQSQDSVQVTLDNNAPSSVAGEDKALTCDQEQVILLGSSDATDVTYEWQDINGTIVANQPNFTVTQAGTYRLIVTSTTNNCSQVDEVTVTDNRVEPNVSIQTLRTLLNCANSTTVLRAERANITDNYTYEWINTNTNSILGTEDSLLVSEAGTYQLVVIDPINGCRSTLSQSIDADDDLPTISIANVPTFECDTESVQLSASADGDNLSFAWTTADGDTITNATDVTVLLPGFYTFTATNLDNGCASSTTVQVARSAEIPSVVINSRITELTCTDNEIELQGDTSAGLNYEWSDEEGQTVGLESNLIVNTAGRYLLTVTNPQTNCSNSDSITITAEDAFINGLDLKLTAPTCIGEGRGSVVVSNVFGGTAPYSYALDGAAFKTYPQFDFLPPATYTLTVEDAFGCQRDTIFTINEGESIAVDLGGDREISLGESIVIEVQANDEIDQLEWDTTDSLECSDCPSQTVTPLETTTYGVMVMNAEGCMAMDEIIVNVSKERLLYLPTAFSPDGDGSNEVFFVGVGQDVERIEEMSIYDRWGTLLFSVSDIPPNDARYGWDGKFKGNTLRTNIYICKSNGCLVDIDI